MRDKLQKILTRMDVEMEGLKDVRSASKLRRLQKQLLRFLYTDALTGTMNRWRFEEVLYDEMEKASAGKKPLCLMMIDIDGFKAINDRHGHDAGDRVLKRVAHQIQSQVEGSVGASERLGRWGGEEFLYVFPSKGLKETKRIAEAIRKSMENWYKDGDSDMPVTVSIGITSLTEKDTCHTIIKRADVAMYKAKHRGGNKVETHR